MSGIYYDVYANQTRSHHLCMMYYIQLCIILLCRRLVDDSLGVKEPLNETGQYGDGLIVRGKHYNNSYLITSLNLLFNIAH